MQKKQFHQTRARKPLSPKRILGLLVALIVFFLLLTSVINLAEKYFAVRGRIQELKAEEFALNEKEGSLRTINEYLAKPEGQEQALRDKYNLIRPGEEIIIITQDSPVQRVDVSKSRVQRWWDAILRGLGMRKDTNL